MKTNNDDNGSLFTSKLKLQVGQTIRIHGEAWVRTVTYVMGSDRKGWRACFRGQGSVPTGEVEWETAERMDGGSPKKFANSSVADSSLKEGLVSQQGTRIDGQKRAESEGGQGCVHLKQLA